MKAYILNIEDRIRVNPIGVASLADFEFSEGNSIDAQIVIKNPSVSLYCLDHENRRAIFVETPGDVDLSPAAFYYQAQYENAIGLLAVPYETFHQLAKDIQLDSNRLILIYSVGRCGSTLLSSVLNEVEGLGNLSEPDVFTQLVAIREWDGSNEAEVSELLKSSTKMLCKSAGKDVLPTGWAIKFRNFGIEIADLLYQHFPDAKTIFLYRNAETWLESISRAFGQEMPASTEDRKMAHTWLSRLVPAMAKYSTEQGTRFSFAEIATLMWLSVMERYVILHQQGIPMLAVRFEDLTRAPRRTIQAVFEYCNITTSNLAEVLKVMEKDSQAGTVLSRAKLQQREVGFLDKYKAEMAQILQSHPMIQTPDFAVPNTLHLSKTSQDL